MALTYAFCYTQNCAIAYLLYKQTAHTRNKINYNSSDREDFSDRRFEIVSMWNICKIASRFWCSWAMSLIVFNWYTLYEMLIGSSLMCGLYRRDE